MRRRVASGNIQPETVPDRDGLDSDEQPRRIGVGELDPVAVEALHAAERPAALKLRRVLACRLPRRRQQLRHRLPVANQRLREGVSAGGRLDAPAQDGDGRDALPSGVCLEAHVASDEVGPARLVGPQQDMGFDADGGESLGELAAHQFGLLEVCGEADDADGGAGLGIAGEAVADRAPYRRLVSRSRREVDAGDGEVGAHRHEDDRLLGLEAEQVRDGRDQLVGVLYGEGHAA